MFRLTAAVLLLTATAASADTIGDDFCTEMQKEYLACGDEALTTNSNGQYKMECPDTIKRMEATYDSVKLKAKAARRPELDRANELWRDIVFRIGRGLGEGEDQFKSRRNRQIQDIVSECEKLQALGDN
jgi:hypothetical protein